MFNFDETFWSNAGFTVLNLLILYFVLKKLLFKPVTAYMESRSAKIDEAINSANSAKEETKRLEVEYREKLKAASEEGKKIVEEHKAMANTEYNFAIANAKRDAKTLVDDARKEIEVEKEKAIVALKEEVSDLVISASEKVIKKNMDTDTNRKLVSEFIDDAGVA